MSLWWQLRLLVHFLNIQVLDWPMRQQKHCSLAHMTMLAVKSLCCMLIGQSEIRMLRKYTSYLKSTVDAIVYIKLNYNQHTKMYPCLPNCTGFPEQLSSSFPDCTPFLVDWSPKHIEHHLIQEVTFYDEWNTWFRTLSIFANCLLLRKWNSPRRLDLTRICTLAIGLDDITVTETVFILWVYLDL